MRLAPLSTVILTLGALVPAAVAQADHQPIFSRCRTVRGEFTDTFLSGPVDCPDSPIQLCTRGQLTGDLRGPYGFSFTVMTSVQGSKSAFLGMSTVVTRNGVLMSQDEGFITENATGESPFSNHIHFVSGTDKFKGASGDLLALGEANLITGAGHGTYLGTLCEREQLVANH